MNQLAFRIIKSKRVAAAFDGEGARLHGGRWNSPGTRMVYVASSRSLATLELLVHIEDLSILEEQFSVIPVEIPGGLILRIDAVDLPGGWHLPEPVAETQLFGDAWIRDGHTAVMEVPSAVINEERNYLINPAHADFPSIMIGAACPFRIDPRLA